MTVLLFFGLGFVHGYIIYKLNSYVVPKVPNLWAWHAVFGFSCIVIYLYLFVWPPYVSSHYVLSTLFQTCWAAFPGIYFFNCKQFDRYAERLKMFSYLLKLFDKNVKA